MPSFDLPSTELQGRAGRNLQNFGQTTDWKTLETTLSMFIKPEYHVITAYISTNQHFATLKAIEPKQNDKINQNHVRTIGSDDSSIGLPKGVLTRDLSHPVHVDLGLDRMADT